MGVMAYIVDLVVGILAEIEMHGPPTRKSRPLWPVIGFLTFVVLLIAFVWWRNR